jgi:hypothetical protein
VNRVPLLVMIELGTPKQYTMSWTKVTDYLEPILDKGLALIHLVNLSTVSSRWVKPLDTFLKGPKWSRPYTTKGHVMGVVWISWAGA